MISTITKCKHGGCDLKQDIAYILKKKEIEFVSKEDLIQNTISDITYSLRKKLMESVSMKDVIQNMMLLTH